MNRTTPRPTYAGSAVPECELAIVVRAALAEMGREAPAAASPVRVLARLRTRRNTACSNLWGVATAAGLLLAACLVVSLWVQPRMTEPEGAAVGREPGHMAAPVAVEPPTHLEAGHVGPQVVAAAASGERTARGVEPRDAGESVPDEAPAYEWSPIAADASIADAFRTLHEWLVSTGARRAVVECSPQRGLTFALWETPAPSPRDFDAELATLLRYFNVVRLHYERDAPLTGMLARIRAAPRP